MKQSSAIQVGIFRAVGLGKGGVRARAEASLAMWMLDQGQRQEERIFRGRPPTDELSQLRATVARLEDRVCRLEAQLKDKESGFRNLARTFGPVLDDEAGQGPVELPHDLIDRLLQDEV